MKFAESDLTRDGFFGQILQIYQPKQGYRAATDPVFLAASAPIMAGQKVLELGCGAGVALCCVKERVPGVEVYGVEIQPEYAELAKKNLAENGFDGIVSVANIAKIPGPIGQLDFDHVIANPPFFNSFSHTSPSNTTRCTAHIAQPNTTSIWVDVALKRLRPRGFFSMIHRVEALPEILTALASKAGNIKILPIAARNSRPAARVLVQAQKTMRGDLKLCPPFVVHTGEAHGDAQDGFSDLARAVLRHGAALPI